MKKIIYTDMVGDLFHYGHVRFLKKCRELGDFLIVGIISDKDAKSYKRDPIMNLQERTEVIESCKYVDKVIKGSPLIVNKEFLDKNRIDIVAHAFSNDNDWKIQMETFFKNIPQEKFKIIEYTKTISTTDIIQRLLK